MDKIREQLEKLMGGVTKDTSWISNSYIRQKKFTDGDVCRHFLCGLCPFDLFENTKLNLGRCSRLHNEDLRKRYIVARESEKYFYEEDSLRIFQQILDDCDRKISRGLVRCVEDGDGEQIKFDPEEETAAINGEIKQVEEDISEKMKTVAELGESGNVDRSMKMMDEVSDLKRQREALYVTLKTSGSNPYPSQKLKPCNICGALLPITDRDGRLEEHFVGKIHLAFSSIRDHVPQLQEYIKKDVAAAPDAVKMAVEAQTDVVPEVPDGTVSPELRVACVTRHPNKDSMERDMTIRRSRSPEPTEVVPKKRKKRRDKTGSGEKKKKVKKHKKEGDGLKKKKSSHSGKTSSSSSSSRRADKKKGTTATQRKKKKKSEDGAGSEGKAKAVRHKRRALDSGKKTTLNRPKRSASEESSKEKRSKTIKTKNKGLKTKKKKTETGAVATA